MKKTLKRIFALAIVAVLVFALAIPALAAAKLSVKNLKIKASDKSATITWSVTSGAEGYKVYLRTGKTYDLVSNTKAHHFEITNLKPSAKYYVKVVPYNFRGVSGSETIKSFTTLKASIPAPKKPKFISSTSNGASISWLPVVNASYYNVYLIKKTESAQLIASTDEANYQIHNLTPGVKYTVQITAVDSKERESAKSPAMTFVAGATNNGDGELPAPQGISISSVSSGSVSLSWTPVSGANSYYLYISLLGGQLSHVKNTTSTSATISGLRPGANYAVYVASVNSVNHVGPLSNAVAFVTGAQELLRAPTNVSASDITSGSATVFWNPVVGAYKYDVYMNSTVGTSGKIASTRDNRAYISGLQAGASYSVTVVAVSEYGIDSAASNTFTFVTPSAVSLFPVNVSNVTGNANSATISFIPALGAYDYEIYISNGGGYNLAATVFKSPTTISGLMPGTNYNVKIRAVDNMGNPGSFGTEYSFTTMPSSNPPIGGGVTIG